MPESADVMYVAFQPKLHILATIFYCDYPEETVHRLRMWLPHTGCGNALLLCHLPPAPLLILHAISAAATAVGAATSPAGGGVAVAAQTAAAAAAGAVDCGQRWIAGQERHLHSSLSP